MGAGSQFEGCDKDRPGDGGDRGPQGDGHPAALLFRRNVSGKTTWPDTVTSCSAWGAIPGTVTLSGLPQGSEVHTQIPPPRPQHHQRDTSFFAFFLE